MCDWLNKFYGFSLLLIDYFIMALAVDKMDGRDLSRRSWSPTASGPPGPSMANFVAVDGPPGPIMAATDGPPLPQVVPPVYFNPLQLLE